MSFLYSGIVDFVRMLFEKMSTSYICRITYRGMESDLIAHINVAYSAICIALTSKLIWSICAIVVCSCNPFGCV